MWSVASLNFFSLPSTRNYWCSSRWNIIIIMTIIYLFIYCCKRQVAQDTWGSFFFIFFSSRLLCSLNCPSSLTFTFFRNFILCERSLATSSNSPTLTCDQINSLETNSDWQLITQSHCSSCRWHHDNVSSDSTIWLGRQLMWWKCCLVAGTSESFFRVWKLGMITSDSSILQG